MPLLQTRLKGICLWEKYSLVSTCCGFEKEKLQTFTIFPDLTSIFHLLCKFQDFSRIQDSVQTLKVEQLE